MTKAKVVAVLERLRFKNYDRNSPKPYHCALFVSPDLDDDEQREYADRFKEAFKGFASIFYPPNPIKEAKRVSKLMQIAKSKRTRVSKKLGIQRGNNLPSIRNAALGRKIKATRKEAIKQLSASLGEVDAKLATLQAELDKIQA